METSRRALPGEEPIFFVPALIMMSCSCGEVYNVMGESPPAGNLTTVQVDSSGRADFRHTSWKLKVSNLIGRSICIRNSANG